MKKLSIIILSTSALLFMSCNTTIGVARDMRTAGEAIEKTALKKSGGDSAQDSAAPTY
jgi:predicted small secreted protein